MRIEDLVFYIKLPPMNYTQGDEPRLDSINIMQPAYKYIAEYVIAKDKRATGKKLTAHEKYMLDRFAEYDSKKKMLWFFSFCWARVQWEMMCRGVFRDGETKISTFDLYLADNADLFLKLIDSVTPASARTWLRKNRKTN